MSFTVLVCGGRDFADVSALDSVLSYIKDNHAITKIVHGGAKGADTLAGVWGQLNGIDVDVYHADWVQFGRSAGTIWNRWMLEESKPDLVLAFPGGRGTADMVRRSRKAGVRTITVEILEDFIGLQEQARED